MPAGEKFIPRAYYFSIALLLVSLPLSKFTMSVAQFLITGVFILDGISKRNVISFFEKNHRFKACLFLLPTSIWWVFDGIARKFRIFFHRENCPAWIFSSLLLLHVVGLLLTTDIDYALKDIRIKLPIFLLPLFLSTTGKIDRKAFPVLMYLFFAALVAGTLISTYLYFTREATDIREASPFISHIRFSLLIDIAIFALFYMIFKKDGISVPVRVLLAFTLAWFVAFLVISTSMTGLVIFALTGLVMVIFILFVKKKTWISVVVSVGILVCLSLAALVLNQVRKTVYAADPSEVQNPEKLTALGNPYWHDSTNLQVENGHYVWYYLATDELRQTWNSRSKIDFDGTDLAGQEIKSTIIRFLTSKGYRKDAGGVAKLNDREIGLIEQGVASTVYAEHHGIYVRVYKIIWEYKRFRETGNPTGHSVMQRFEYWRAARNIIQRNWLTGVGTGDLNTEFQKEYENMQSLLDQEHRWRTHNQFLSIFVAFGLLGLGWFMVTLIFPPARMHKFHDYYYLSFFVIVILSMISEDTLETQAGVTIYAFFTSFYLFAKKFIDVV
jgi:hypothetical protein